MVKWNDNEITGEAEEAVVVVRQDGFFRIRWKDNGKTGFYGAVEGVAPEGGVEAAKEMASACIEIREKYKLRERMTTR